MFDITVRPEDVGRTLSFSSGPIFDEVKGLLTDGVNETILFGADPGLPGYGGPPNSGGTGGFLSEAYLFYGDASGAKGIDFAGFALSSIDFRIDQLTLDTPGQNPNGDGIWTDQVIRATLTVNEAETAVPEPATFWVLITPLAGFLLFSLRHTASLRVRGQRPPKAIR